MFSHSRIAPYHKLKKRKNDMPPRPLENSAIHPFEIARESSTLQACQTRQDPAPQKAKPSPVTTPPPTASTPSRPSSRESSARPTGSPTAPASALSHSKNTYCMYRKTLKLPNELNVSSKGGVDYRGGLLVPAADRGNRWATRSPCQLGEKARGNLRRDGHRPIRLPPRYGLKGKPPPPNPVVAYPPA